MRFIGKLFMSLMLVAMVIPLTAQTKGAKTWQEAVVELRQNIEDGKIKGVKPYYSEVKRLKTDAEKVTFDLTGVERFIITASDARDGNVGDFAAVGNPILTDLQGNKIQLTDLTPDFEIGYDYSPVYDINRGHNRKIAINGKSYDRGICVQAEGKIIYKLDGQYKSFEAEVGAEDGGRVVTTVIISLRDERLDESVLFETMAPEHSEAMKKFLYQSCTLFDEYVFPAEGVNVEKSIADRVVEFAATVNKDYYRTKIEEYTSLEAKTQAIAYIDLVNEMMTLSELNEKLKWVNLEALSLYLDDMKSNSSFDYAANKAMYDELASSFAEVKGAISKGDITYIDKAEAALALRDKLIFANPLLGSDILMARFKIGTDARKIMTPSLGTQISNYSNQESAIRSEYDASVSVLSGVQEGNTQIRTVYKPTNGSPISDLRLHWDADRAMFTGIQEDGRWNVFETDLKNGGAKKLMEIPEPDIEFYDGTYLPNGRIIVTSNIGYQAVPCVNGLDPVGNMVLYTPDTKSFRRLTFDQDANWNPTITNDGKVMYTRWEYTDLTHYYSRIVMTMNPDGTEQRALYGSGYMFPNSVFDMESIPGHSSAFVGIVSGHHGVARSGRLILFDPKKSRKGAAGMLQEIPYRGEEIEEVLKDRLVDDVWPQFIKPTPLNDKYFLVAAKLTAESLWGVYLVDVFDNVTCLYEAEGEGVISPLAIRKSETPPAIPDRVVLGDKESTIFIQDIYEGEGLPGVPRGSVKELRIFAYEYAYLETVSDHNWHGIQSGWDIKRLLGTAPIEEDGSALFKVPANTPIAIQPVGKDGAAMQWMRSWFTGMPGEVVSCVGCHEDLNQIAMPKRVIASTIQPHQLTPPEGGLRPMTFDLQIQPILDRACVACHNGNEAFDLSDTTKDKFGFGKSYLNFHPYIHRQGGEGDQPVLSPYEYHPNTSELVRMLKKGHYNVELTDKEWHALYNWIDFNAPDKGYFNDNTPKKVPVCGQDQYARRIHLTDTYANGASVDWRKEIEDYTALLESKGKIEAEMPKPVKEAKVKDVKVKNWPFEATADADKKTIEIGNGVKMNFVRIPAGDFVMGSNKGENDAKPAGKVSIDKEFWMGEIEVSNEQYNVLFPDHTSRYMDQQWKDHINPGYPAFLPEQPVIRVSWNEAMAFCEELSKQTGLNITLPSESQWEWACRAGTDTDFWYGSLNSDFGSKENMADKTTLLFAVAGMDPQPMKPNNAMYKHYTFLPKDESVDDGSLIQVKGASYDANPFGLYDMHGNVAEWTRSDYLPYPYGKSKEEAEYKTVRGGSSLDRPKKSTSHSRRGYYPYQRVYNVGFRVIIEE
ncbi:MAG: SUMF1/EgtB/PvdO family nonheme iron enzyme [Rikenellaceae bacterium]